MSNIVSHYTSTETIETPIVVSDTHGMHPVPRQIDTSYASTSSSNVTPIFDATAPQKRKINITDLSTSGSTSTDSSKKRRRTAQRIKFFHSYSLSPRSLKKKYVQAKRKHAVMRQKFYDSKKKITSLQKTIFNMKSVMTFVKNTQFLSEDAVENVEKTYDSVPHLLMQRYLKNITNKTVTHESYPSILRRFAATLQFYSMKAYEAVRNEFALALPHQATIRKWYQNVNCEPGFLTPAFDALKLKVEELRQKNHDLLCSLILDEISIKKQLDVDGTRAWGYVNIGVPTENDDLTPATEALVLMVVCLTGHWKLPVAYFFIASLSAKQKANIVNETLIRLHNVGVDVPSITCDGPTTNFAMFKELGCNLDNVFDMKTWFSHPSATNKKVYCVLDACHMLKLIRNNWSNLDTIKNPDGDLVRWVYVKELYKLQEAEGLHVANKLKRAHMEWYRQKMKVHLAAQTLSRSVADAIEYLNTRHLEEFKGSEATVDFIRKINDLFDLLNSRSPRASGFKAPLRLCNEAVWRPFILNTVHYLLRCTDVGGRPLHMTPKKTPFLGFAITSFSVCGIYDSLVKVEKLKYFLTYKVSQDHLEIFFCSIRQVLILESNTSCLI
ncbi:hypothetical protein PPYR_10038 [Photinus pyralis]|uniref:THAP-type domain-containing protein n=1 Tax=Photinus pyralis TaxID=7054 RepID=A0A5N4AF64_PHOPY|nr:hypothetical protein PPYR_10038 [Photinus pyralis]